MRKFMANQRGMGLLIALGVVILDQVTKYLAVAHLSLSHALDLFPGLALVLHHNRGAGFGFLADSGGWQRWFFVSLAVVIGGIIFVWLGRLKKDEKLEGFALSLILGGAIGNLIDRLIQGYVVDFILVYYKEWVFPTFNIADSAISLGVVLFVFQAFKKPKT